MIRTDIEIPKNIKYLGEIRNIELPYGTFDRFELPNGAEYAIFNNGSAQTGDLKIPDVNMIYSNGQWSKYSE